MNLTPDEADPDDELLIYSWVDFNRDMGTILEKTRYNQATKCDLIVGIERGGLIPATCLSYAFGVPMMSLKGVKGTDIINKRILLVDDLTDSGKSIKRHIAEIEQYGSTVTVCTLLHNSDLGDLEVPHIYGSTFSRQTEKRYFNFWWEIL